MLEIVFQTQPNLVDLGFLTRMWVVMILMGCKVPKHHQVDVVEEQIEQKGSMLDIGLIDLEASRMDHGRTDLVKGFK